MRRQRVEDVKGKTPIIEPAKERRKLSKAELREQAEAAVVAWRAGQTFKNKWRPWRVFCSLARTKPEDAIAVKGKKSKHRKKPVKKAMKSGGKRDGRRER